MNKYLSFFLILVFVGVSFTSKAAPRCEAVFNRTEIKKILNQLPHISYFDSLNNRSKKMEKVGLLVDDLISKKMLNDPDLAHTIVYYLMAMAPYDRYQTWQSKVQKIISDPQIYQLVITGKRISFKSSIVESEVSYAESQMPFKFYFGEIPSSAFFKLFLDLLKPSDVQRIDDIADKLTHHMNFFAGAKDADENTKLYSSIPNYNRFKVIKTILKQHFNVSDKNYQEILVINRGVNTKRVIVISNQPILDEDNNLLGLSMKSLDVFHSESKNINKRYTWRINKEEFSSEITYKNQGTVDLKIAEGESPNYAQMLKDKKLTGVIVVANNVGDYAEDLKNSYLDYLKSEKFKSSPLKRISSSDARSFILNIAQDGEIDYFIREGHLESGGDRLITFSENNEIYKLNRMRKNFTEEIYLVVPSGPQEMAGDNLDSSSFGQALRSRAEQNQLLYFDSSCKGNNHVDYSFKSVAAEGFTPMGSDKMLDTFTGRPFSAVYEFLHGVRNQLSYTDMTKNIKGDENIITPNNPSYEASRNRTHIVPIIDLKIKRNFPHE